MYIQDVLFEPSNVIIISKLFVIPKNVSSRTYFILRGTSFDRNRSSLGRCVSKISRCFFKWSFRLARCVAYFMTNSLDPYADLS